MQPGDVPATTRRSTGSRRPPGSRRTRRSTRPRALRRLVSRLLRIRDRDPWPGRSNGKIRRCSVILVTGGRLGLQRALRRPVATTETDHHDPRHRRRRLHRRQLRARLVRRDATSRVVNLDKLTYAGNLDNLASLRDDPRHVFVRGDIGDRRAGRRAARGASAARDRELRGRDPRRPLDRRPGGVRRDQRRRHVQAARSARRTGSALPDAERARVPLPARLDRRSVRLARARRPAFSETTPYAPNSPTRHRRPRPITWCAPITTPTACRRSRPTARTTTALPVSREADPADDPQRARGQAAAGLWRRPERPRLAVRRGSLRGDPRGARARPPGRDLQHRRQRREDEPRRRAHALPRCWTSCVPGRDFARADHVRQGPPGPRPPLRDRRHQDPPRARLGAARRRSKRASRRPSAGISTTAPGSTR